MAARLALLLASVVPAASGAFLARGLQASEVTANPVRKVVTLLQAMQKKVTEEGEKEAELYKKFACYCSKSGGDLKGSIAAAEAKVPSVGSDIKAAEEQKAQLGEDLKQHQVDRSDAKAAMEEATAIREKEAAAFAKEKAEYTANLQAIRGAVAAISKGMAGGFLQTGAARALRRALASQREEMLDADREAVLAFLSDQQGATYVPKSSEVTGILKELGASMSKNLAEASAEEKAAVQNYEELMAAKKKEVAALTSAVESKTVRTGELAVQIVQMKHDLTDTEEALMDDQKFLADLEQGCGKKAAEWDARVQTRAEELAAIAEAIKVLNDDDALDLFKKTLPSPGTSFVQVHAVAFRQRREALAAIRDAQRLFGPDRAGLDFIALALQGRQVGFEKVIKMVDGLVADLAKEQQDDDQKKEYCAAQLDQTDDQKKALERSVSDRELAIDSAKEGVAKTSEELKALEKSIAQLDKSVLEATRQRKAEHEEFTELMSQNSAAKELLGLAINKLNRFYNPRLHKPEPTEAPVLAEVSAHGRRGREAPAPPPETFGAYAKKAESSGVIALLNRLIKDLEKEMTEAETTEEGAQADYEEMMKDSAEKRATASKSLTEKGALKASLETDMQDHTDAKNSAQKELSATTKYIASLHSECDWLLQYFDVRKSARAGEVDALKKAKAVLQGADFSFVETSNARGLQRKA